MINLLVRLFVKDSDDVKNPQVRERYGKLGGAVGIASNLVLFLLKIAVGILSGSIAIMADAVNNLSDCASSVITLVAFKLSSLPPDEKHPYGHARFEYISGMIVSFLIIAIGFQFFTSSVKKIITPQPVAFSAAVIAVLALSIAIKLWQGLFNRRIGERIQSDALKATAADSLNDAITTAAVLIGAAIGHFSGYNFDGWLGLAVALFILISGGKLVIETLNPLLGAAPDRELVRQIEQMILSYDSVIGVHDLIVHNYGPGRCFASVHAEVPAHQDILISHDIIDNIERDIGRELGIELVVHLDPIVTDDERINQFHAVVGQIVRSVDEVLNMHDFRVVEGKTHTNFIFDVVVPPRFRLTDKELCAVIETQVRQALEGEFYCVITVDHSYTTVRQDLQHPIS